jgi:hypothetical protein
MLPHILEQEPQVVRSHAGEYRHFCAVPRSADHLLLNHNYIGTERILFGLIHEGEGVVAKALLPAAASKPVSAANGQAPARADCLRPGLLQARLAAMTSGIDSNPEDEYADDEYTDHDAEDREQPSTPADIPDDEPEEDVLEQRQEVPYREDDR